jgi:hypothetical protein
VRKEGHPYATLTDNWPVHHDLRQKWWRNMEQKNKTKDTPLIMHEDNRVDGPVALPFITIPFDLLLLLLGFLLRGLLPPLFCKG